MLGPHTEAEKATERADRLQKELIEARGKGELSKVEAERDNWQEGEEFEWNRANRAEYRAEKAEAERDAALERAASLEHDNDAICRAYALHPDDGSCRGNPCEFCGAVDWSEVGGYGGSE